MHVLPTFWFLHKVKKRLIKNSQCTHSSMHKLPEYILNIFIFNAITLYSLNIMWPEKHLCLYSLVKVNMCSSMLDWYALTKYDLLNNALIVWIGSNLMLYLETYIICNHFNYWNGTSLTDKCIGRYQNFL